MRTDENELIGFKYNNEIYYYKKNYQGDIIGIYDSNYELVCIYEYDSYGRVVSIKDVLGNVITEENHIANINPYRYRSYYYDRETKLYYLNSRYYNPEWGRFINADGIINANKDFISSNLYAYVSNNPVLASDNGKFILSKIGRKAVALGIKTLTKIVSYAVGKIKDMPISSSMLNNAIDNKDLSNKTKLELRRKIKYSSEMKKEVNNCVSKNRGRESFECSKGVNGDVGFVSDSDLRGSVGHAKYQIRGFTSPTRDKINLYVHVSDTYDFTDPNLPINFFEAANDYGVALQFTGLLKPYQWDINYTITVPIEE